MNEGKNMKKTIIINKYSFFIFLIICLSISSLIPTKTFAEVSINSDSTVAQQETKEFCVCPKCGYKQLHQRGVPCRSIHCPKCKSSLLHVAMQKELQDSNPRQTTESSNIQKDKKNTKIGRRQKADEFCICPGCGNKQPHQRNIPCRSIHCSNCGSIMVGENVASQKR
jgi:hypothetical protein